MLKALEEQAFRNRIERIETLLQEVERFPDTAARAHTKEIVQAIMDLHGAGLEKMLEHIAETGNTGLAMIDDMARDDLVGSLFLLYGLHPQDFTTRVRQALDKVRPYLRSHGGNVELMGIDGGVVRLQMQGSCHSCPSSAMTLKMAIKEAIYAAAPDVTAIEVEGVVEERPLSPSSTFVPVEALTVKNGR